MKSIIDDIRMLQKEGFSWKSSVAILELRIRDRIELLKLLMNINPN